METRMNEQQEVMQEQQAAEGTHGGGEKQHRHGHCHGRQGQGGCGQGGGCGRGNGNTCDSTKGVTSLR